VDTATEASGVLDKTDTMATYARRVRADTETINALQFAKLLIIAKLAELMPRSKGGRGKTRAGGAPVFSRHTISDYRKIGDHADRLNEYRDAVAEHNDQLPAEHPGPKEISAAGFIRFVGSDGSREGVLTGNPEWYTPAEYIELAREVMGKIDLDPASNPFAQETVKAEQFYTEDDDGLSQPWWGQVWLNPLCCAQHKGFIQQIPSQCCTRPLFSGMKNFRHFAFSAVAQTSTSKPNSAF